MNSRCIHILKKSFSVKFTKSHEWVKILSGNKASVGISNHAKEELGEIVYVELNKDISENINQLEEIGMLESTKASAPVYLPVSGKIIKKNDEVLAKINASPEEEGWLYEIEVTNKDELKSLLSREEYLAQI